MEDLEVRVGGDTSDLKRAFDSAHQDVGRFAQKMQGTANVAAQRAREVAQKAADAMQQQFAMDMARVREGQARGFINAQQAEKAGRDAAAAYNRGMLSIIDRTARTPGAFQGQQGTLLFTRLTGSLQNVDKAARGGMRGLGEMRESVASLAAQVAGAHPIVGRFVNVAGGLAVSSGIMIGILGGLAALALAWNKVTESTRKAKEETEATIQRTDALMERRRNTELAQLAKQETEAIEQEKNAREELERFDLAAGRVGGNEKRRRQLAADLAEMTLRLQTVRDEIARVKGEKIEENLDAWNKKQKELNKTTADAKREFDQYVEALMAVVKAGEGTVANEEELRKIRVDSLAVLRDENRTLQERAEALRRVTAATNALIEAQIQQIQLDGDLSNPYRQLMRAPNGALVHGVKPIVRHVTAINPRTLDLGAAGGGLSDIFSQMQEQMMAQLVALPQQMMSSMIGQLTSLLGQGLGQLFTTIFFGKQRHGSYDVIKRLEDAAERQMEAAEELKKAAHSIRNVPFTYNAEFARHRIGMTRAATSGGPPSISQVVIQASPTGDSPTSLWRKFETAFYTAEREGNTLARSMLPAPAGG